jgi:hypothetical protein
MAEWRDRGIMAVGSIVLRRVAGSAVLLTYC